ncbi:uncharacterized protein C16C10.8 [Prorops nasuta]|uniref:uncharacterized protein C16C10.8 n=1 Tax=Prorops nasuta TaxID=863751 RepID=UPI0034CD2147
MVCFTCNHCGESLAKPRVSKHYQFQCHRKPFVTCVDCLKDFHGEEFIEHTKCVTENERYGGKNYMPKPGANKGEKKQLQWINVVHNLLSTDKSLTNAERSFLETLTNYDNIPRKKAKFLNFINNAIGNRVNMALIHSVWSKMENSYQQKSLEDIKEHNKAENQNNENICKENEGNANYLNNVGNTEELKNKINQVQRPKKKRKNVEQKINNEPAFKKSTIDVAARELNEVKEQSTDITFDWKNAILNAIKCKQEISLRKLQKKIVLQYISQGDHAETPEKVLKKFNRNIAKLSEVCIVNEKVKLI